MSDEGKAKKRFWWRQPEDAISIYNCPATPQLGQNCEACGVGKYDLDGLLRLVCPECGHVPESGAFT